MVLQEYFFTESQQEQLAKYLPLGRVWSNKNSQSSKLGALIQGFAQFWSYVDARLWQAYTNGFIRTVDTYIDEYVKAYGADDTCGLVIGDLQRKRALVEVQLTRAHATTLAEFYGLLSAFGIGNIVILPGLEYYSFPASFPIEFRPPRASKFTVVVEVQNEFLFGHFPLQFPFLFGDTYIPFIKCILRKVLPSNVDLVFKPIEPQYVV